MKTFIDKLYRSRFLGTIFHTLDYCLQKELKNCESVLDLGCGPSSPLQYCKNVKHSVGVEAFTDYLNRSKKSEIHTEYLNKNIKDVNFPNDSFDAVIFIEVLEHLTENEGMQILEKAGNWAKKKIIVTSPNGFINQKEVDNNPLQKHLSGWDYKKMRKMGFKIRGLAGLKFLRQEGQSDVMEGELLHSIRFRPKSFWFLAAALSQIFTYWFPSIAYELLSVKKKQQSK